MPDVDLNFQHTTVYYEMYATQRTAYILVV